MSSLTAHRHSPWGPKRVALTAGLIWVFVVISAGASPQELPFISITVNGHRLIVEVAATPSARRHGLSHRTTLPDDQGMLFVYPTPMPLSFWMKDTQIPLSIAFLDDARRILSIQKMVPMEVEERYRSPCPTRYALEVNQGWFARHAIKVGDVVDLQIPEVLDIR